MQVLWLVSKISPHASIRARVVSISDTSDNHKANLVALGWYSWDFVEWHEALEDALMLAGYNVIEIDCDDLSETIWVTVH